MFVFGEGSADAFDEGGGVELGAEDFVGAVGEDGDAPVAEEGDELVVMRGLDFGAEPLGGVDALFAFDVDEYEVERLCFEEDNSLGVGEGGVYEEAGEAQDLVAEGAKNLAAADVEDGFWFRRI